MYIDHKLLWLDPWERGSENAGGNVVKCEARVGRKGAQVEAASEERLEDEQDCIFRVGTKNEEDFGRIWGLLD